MKPGLAGIAAPQVSDPDVRKHAPEEALTSVQPG